MMKLSVVDCHRWSQALFMDYTPIAPPLYSQHVKPLAINATMNTLKIVDCSSNLTQRKVSPCFGGQDHTKCIASMGIEEGIVRKTFNDIAKVAM
jgi:hypothetical protein